MINLYCGTNGSGKSLHVAHDILRNINVFGRNVIANFTVNESMFKKNAKGKFLYVDNQKMTPEFLIDFAIKNHKPRKESQTLLVIDEAQILFNARDTMGNSNRMEWLKFFTQHRKLGYNVLFICPFDRMLDRQIRSLIEYKTIHRKVNNFKIGWILSVFGISLFIAVESWYGVNIRTSVDFFVYRRKYGRFYDSFKMFDAPSPGGTSSKLGGSPGDGLSNLMEEYTKMLESTAAEGVRK